MRSKRYLATFTAVAALLAGGAGSADAKESPSFSGACDFHGMEILTDRPITDQQRPINLDISGPGRCTGLVSGVPRTESVTQLTMRVGGVSGCLGTTGYLTGNATFLFDDGTRLPVAASMRVDAPGYFVLTFGNQSGSAYGTGLPVGTIPLDTVSGGLESLLEYDFGCFTGAVCDRLGQPCETMRRAGFAFDMATMGTLRPSMASEGPPPTLRGVRRTPRLSSLLAIEVTKACRRGGRLRVGVKRSWRPKVRSVMLRARGRTASGRSRAEIAGPTGRSLEVTFDVRLRDGRVRVEKRRFICA